MRKANNESMNNLWSVLKGIFSLIALVLLVALVFLMAAMVAVPIIPVTWFFAKFLEADVAMLPVAVHYILLAVLTVCCAVVHSQMVKKHHKVKGWLTPLLSSLVFVLFMTSSLGAFGAIDDKDIRSFMTGYFAVWCFVDYFCVFFTKYGKGFAALAAGTIRLFCLFVWEVWELFFYTLDIDNSGGLLMGLVMLALIVGAAFVVRYFFSWRMQWKQDIENAENVLSNAESTFILFWQTSALWDSITSPYGFGSWGEGVEGKYIHYDETHAIADYSTYCTDVLSVPCHCRCILFIKKSISGEECTQIHEMAEKGWQIVTDNLKSGQKLKDIPGLIVAPPMKMNEEFLWIRRQMMTRDAMLENLRSLSELLMNNESLSSTPFSA